MIYFPFLSNNNKNKDVNDWKYVSQVIDRLLLWIFASASLIGTLGILLQAPSIYDYRPAIIRT